MSSTQNTIQAHDQYMILNYPRQPVVMRDGQGCRLRDTDGREYLDLFSGFGAGILGHCHPDIVAAVTRQANKLWHVGNLLHTEPQVELARQISEKGFGGRCYFAHSGSDANESAFKLARLYGKGKRYEVISTLGSFHGRGFAAMMATGQDKVRHGYEPFLEGFKYVPYGDLAAMKAAVGDKTVAIILEPIQGEGGVHVPSTDYMRGVRALCDERDLLMICDEVWTGCGRTGRYFAYQHFGIEPDVMTLGKAVGVGLPVGVMCASKRVAELFDHRNYGGVPQATTLGGNCLSMAAAARLFDVLERDGLVERAGKLGDAILKRIEGWRIKQPWIKEPRGLGLFLGIELDAKAQGAWFQNGAQVAAKAMEAGLMVNIAQGNVMRLAPPLVISDEELEDGLTRLEKVLAGA